MKQAVLITFAVAVAVLLGVVLMQARPVSAAGAGAAPALEIKNPFAGNTAAVKEGETIFDAKCAECHGGDAMGGSGPDLTDDKWIHGGSDTEVFATVSGGRKGGMPSWKGELKDEEIWKVIAYIRSLHK
jgi:cytochrome c oxidase cbb3-type subunit 3